MAGAYYVETKGHRWATQSVAHKTLEQAHQHAKNTSRECFEARVWDCSSGPVGVLVATYVSGIQQLEAA